LEETKTLLLEADQERRSQCATLLWHTNEISALNTRLLDAEKLFFNAESEYKVMIEKVIIIIIISIIIIIFIAAKVGPSR
jgi:hypothetical protein